MNPNCVVVAGAEWLAKWEEQLNKTIETGGNLCRIQEQQHRAGRCGVNICPSIYGWSVRYDSGLNGFELLASSRSGQLDGSRTAAIEYAEQWTAEDPTHRYAWIWKSDLEKDERFPYGQRP